ncbi:hypothetical protein HRbin15_00644 [bacterium HR15]|nr:hypothetical protein HRbin15_00644 [bacterium HR15]
MKGTAVRSKRIIVALVTATVAFTIASADVSLVHRRSFNLVPLFPSTLAVGDVAFDGTNLYVSAWNSGSGTQTVSLVRLGSLSSMLSASSGSWTTYDWRVDLTQAGGSRDTRLVHHGSSLYWGAGLGDTTAANTGIRKYDLNGNLDTSWAGDGHLSLTEAEVSRYDTIDIDPSFGNPKLAVGVFGSTIVRRFDLSTGANAGNTGAVGGDTSTRDYAFAPNGDLYIRTQGKVSKATRINDTAFNAPVALASWGEGTLAQAFVAYIPISTEFYSGFSDLVLYNQRVSGQNKVFIIRPDGSVFGELTGLEDTGEPGFDEVAFDNTLLNASWGKTADGHMYIFVVKGGTGAAAFGDRLDIYEVVPEPASLLVLGVGLVGCMRLRRRSR